MINLFYSIGSLVVRETEKNNAKEMDRRSGLTRQNGGARWDVRTRLRPLSLIFTIIRVCRSEYFHGNQTNSQARIKAALYPTLIKPQVVFHTSFREGPD